MANKWICLTSKEMQSILNNGHTPASVIKKIQSADKTISVASRKGKGRSLQMWVAKRISKLTGIPFNNQDDQCLIHCREMGQNGVDVILRGKAQKAFPFSVECKNCESLSLGPTIDQAKANETEGTNWLIVHKKKAFSNPIVIMDWDAFEKMFGYKNQSCEGCDHLRTQTCHYDCRRDKKDYFIKRNDSISRRKK